MSIPETTQLTIRRWAVPKEPRADEAVYMDAEDLPQDLSGMAIVLPEADVTRAKQLLKRGARQVLLGDVALSDSNVVKQLADEFSGERIGVWLPTKRMEVSWSLDLDCNADFRCLTPSLGAPSWEVLMSDGSRTGTEVNWWAEQMFNLGASMALIGVSALDDDFDLNICAGLVERFGRRLWFTPLGDDVSDLAPAVRFAKVSQLVLSDRFDEITLKARYSEPQEGEARNSA